MNTEITAGNSLSLGMHASIKQGKKWKETWKEKQM